MNLFLALGLVCILSFIFLIYYVRKAPEGHEDSKGFHHLKK